MPNYKLSIDLLKPFSIVFFLSIFFPVVSQNANQAGFYFKNDSFRPVKDTYVICSWNLKDFGKSKSTETLDFIATTVSNSDVVAIQEVVAGNGGVETVSKLAQILNNGKAHWGYVVSAPTSGNSYKKERYAFLWKTARVQLIGKPWLEKKYSLAIDREPFFADFSCSGNVNTLVNYHAITQKMQPETEIKYFKYIPAEYPEKSLLFLGDFNCPETHTVFNPLKSMGYVAVLKNQKTTLKKNCIQKNCLASAFDNFFYKKENIQVDSAWAFYFFKQFPSMKEAGEITDHLPIFLRFGFN